MLKRLSLLLLLVLAALAGWLAFRRNAPPTVPFTRVTRETIVSTLNTNGKVEPLESAEIRAEREGVVERVAVERGQELSAGQVLLTLDARDAQAELAAAEARLAEARTQGTVLAGGGRTQELTEIDSNLTRARLDQQTTQRELESLRRLVAKNAAPRQELTAAEQRAEQARLQIESLERRRAALVSPADRSIAEARTREAESTATTARRRIELATIRSPIAGTLYEFAVRAGAYLNPGDLVGRVGRLDQVRVIVYVDEPELGRVRENMPVTITWDARPGETWQGTVERVPTQITALGTRQVGEVVCQIENRNRALLPGTNINAEIRSAVVSNVPSIPREALRRENNQTGVFVLQGDRVAWRPVTLGVSSITRTQVSTGLTEQDAVALPTDRPLKAGDAVTPAFP